jgi:putative ABC transport system substrate-binding protein
MRKVRRRQFLLGAGAGCLSLSLPALSQQEKRVPRVGWLLLAGAGNPASKSFLGAFRKGMGELKWVEGRDYTMDVRYANGNAQAVPGLLDELVASRPDLLIAPADDSVRMLKQRTKTIPIVFAIAVDPVRNGLVESLQRPGGNVTGMTNLLNELGPKRLQVLKEAFPQVTHVGVPYEPNDFASTSQAKTVGDAASALGMRATLIEMREMADIEPAFKRAAALGVQAYLPVAGPLAVAHRQKIVDQVLSSRLPAIYVVAQFPDAGGLMSYGPNILDNFRLAAGFVDKILKGAKPGDLPTQQPTRYELVINMKTARVMGLTLPQSILLRADRVIE